MALPPAGSRARTAALVLAVAMAVGACGGDDDPQGETSIPPNTDRPDSSSAAPEGTSEPSEEAGDGGFGEAQSVATDIQVPWGVAFLPDGDALVAERPTGRILQVSPDGEQSDVMTVPDVADMGEGGLLGLATSPTYDDDGLLYAYLTTAEDNRIVRFELGGEPEVILAGIANADIHNGGRIAFGPDGMLYAGTGDAGNTEAAQDVDSLNGKILRLTPDGEPPPDNPFPDSVVYSYGHRNVQGLAWDDSGAMYGVEFGQNEFDEVNLIEPGSNYGWPVVEGEGDTDGDRFTNPLVVWTTEESSPSGAVVINETLYVAALRGERLWSIPVTGPGELGEPSAVLDGSFGRLRTVARAPDGAMWLTTSNTSRGDPRDGDDQVFRLPPT